MAGEAMAGASMVLGMYSAYTSARQHRKDARRASKEALATRRWYEEQARDTQRRLGQEIETMRVLRGLDMPAHQMAMQIAFINQKKGSERVTRGAFSMLGRQKQEIGKLLFGDQAKQYFGREAQKLQIYAGMTKEIQGMTQAAQGEVNRMLAAGGGAYTQLQGQASKMRYDAGSAMAQMAGAAAQGLSLAAQGQMSEEAQDMKMKKQAWLKSGAGQEWLQTWDPFA